MAGPEDQTLCQVLSIQSHVVHGYVGNRSAAFPLQVLGFDVDVVNSVQLSNHTWYKVFKGQVLNADDLATLTDGLRENGLLSYDYLLTGYIGDKSFLLKVCDLVKELKKINPNLIYVCDPVMGDDGVMYVPEELLEVYQKKVLPLADIILPNQMEAEKLMKCTVSSEEDILALMTSIHQKGPSTVVYTSSSSVKTDTVTSYASCLKDGKTTRVKCQFPRLDSAFIGTGDLLAALWLAWSHKHKDDIETVMSKAQSSMQRVLQRTMRLSKGTVRADGSPDWDKRELRLIQSKKDIEQPPCDLQVLGIE